MTAVLVEPTTTGTGGKTRHEFHWCQWHETRPTALCGFQRDTPLGKPQRREDSPLDCLVCTDLSPDFSRNDYCPRCERCYR